MKLSAKKRKKSSGAGEMELEERENGDRGFGGLSLGLLGVGL